MSILTVVFAALAASNAVPDADVVFTAARLVDVEAGSTRSSPVILVKGERIVGVRYDGVVPTGVRRVDLGDVTLLPGLIDSHTHLLGSAGADGYAAMLITQSQAMRALEGAAIAKKTLFAGFTSVRDVENEGSAYADVALRDAIERGLVQGPRMLVATRAIAAVGQYYPFHISPDLVDFPRGAQMVSGVDDARRAVREQIGNGADLIKVYADWTYPTLTVEELKVVVEEAHKAGRRVAAHARTVPGIRNAVTAGVDSIEHGWGADRPTLELMKRSGVWLVPTIGILEMLLAEATDDATKKRLRERLTPALEMVRTARAVGVQIASGFDAGSISEQGHNARELIALNRAGFTPLEVVRAATINGAKLLGKADDVGAVATGKLADIVGVAGDPLADVSLLEHVIVVVKGGALVRDARREIQ